ncbi:MAG: hypothetical protein V4584_14475 [Verrucomicrobiota bacterium]
MKQILPQKFTVAVPPENEVATEAAGHLEGSLRIRKGRRNIVRFGAGCRFTGSISIEGNRNLVEIGAGADIKGQILVKGNRQRVVIGEKTTSEGIRLLASEDCDITIGRSCVFAHKIEIRTTDAHSVVDRETGNRLNPPGSVTIGDRVWVGGGAILNKGSSVPAGSIVEANSFVSRAFEEEGVMLAGVPAKVVRTGITWSRVEKER